MAERESIYVWSTSAAGNGFIDPSINFSENQLPSTLNNSNRAVLAASARYVRDNNGTLTTGGSANAYTLTANNTWSAHATGHELSFKANFANTAAATLALTNADGSALGSKAIRGPGDVALTSGQIVGSGIYDVKYDATANSAAGAWILMNPTTLVNGQTGGDFTVPIAPGGRITFSTATPIMTASVTDVATCYYTPCRHNIIEVHDGTRWTQKTFTELTQALTDSTKSPEAGRGNANYDILASLDSTTGELQISRSRHWLKFAATTITIATPGVLTYTAHGVDNDTPVHLVTTGALPTGLTANAVYYTRNVAANTFEVSSVAGGGSITTSGTQSGTHTAVVGNDTARGTGNGTAELELYEGRWVNKVNVTNGPLARRGRYLGSIRTNSVGTLSLVLGGQVVGGGTGRVTVWNAFNQVLGECRTNDMTNPNWSVGEPTWQVANGNPGIFVLSGLPEHQTRAGYVNEFVIPTVTGAYGSIGIGEGTASVADTYNSKSIVGAPPAVSEAITLTAQRTYPPRIGYRKFKPMNRAGAGAGSTGSTTQVLFYGGDVGTSSGLAQFSIEYIW